jgi:hypothetical protein
MIKILLALMLAACAQIRIQPVPLPKVMLDSDVVEMCLQDQVELFNDLCAEETSGYESMDSVDAYYEGVRCAVEYTKGCLGL